MISYLIGLGKLKKIYEKIRKRYCDMNNSVICYTMNRDLAKILENRVCQRTDRLKKVKGSVKGIEYFPRYGD